MKTVVVSSALACLTLVACGDKAQERASSARADATATVKRPAIQTQPVRKPCDWVTPAAVEGLFGKLTAAPRLGLDAESRRAHQDGSACVYSITARDGHAMEIGLQVDLHGAAEFEHAMGMMGGLFATEMNDGKPTEAPAEEKRTDGWDHVSVLPELTAYRLGHVAVQVGGELYSIPRESITKLAVLVRDQLKDIPFANSTGDPNSAGAAPDACALVSREEAEAVLGPLLVAPYRSIESVPVADGAGPSCSFYAAGHHTLVITPTLDQGKTMYGMVGGISGKVRATVGGSDAGDLLEGPWDQATAGATGSLYFLKGDKMLEVIYRTSSTDIEGAAKIARAAVGRL